MNKSDVRGLLEPLKDVICQDDSLVSQIQDALMVLLKKRGGEKAEDVEAAIDEAVNMVFAECEIFQTVSRAVDRVRAVPRLDESPPRSGESLEKPGFSESEPVESAQLSRASPKSKTPSPDVGRERGKFSNGKYSPLSEPNRTTSLVKERGGDSTRNSTVKESPEPHSVKDEWSPPPAFQQTDSPEIVAGGLGMGMGALLNKSAMSGDGRSATSSLNNSPKAVSPARMHQETMRQCPSKSLSPAISTPTKSPKPRSSPFGSPGSGLENDNFDDSFDDTGMASGGLDFTKRYRFSDGAPDSPGEVVGGKLGKGTLAAALGGLDGDGEEEIAADITDDWLLSRSEGNPDESSLASSSLNNSMNSSLRSSPMSGGKRRSGRNSNSSSPVKRTSPSPTKTKAEAVLRGMIDGLGKTTSPANSISPNKAGRRYGGMRDSLDSPSAASLSSAGNLSPGGSIGKAVSPLSSPRSALSPGSSVGNASSPPRAKVGIIRMGSNANSSSLEGGSSIESDSGGPATLDGGDEVYEAPTTEQTEPELEQGQKKEIKEEEEEAVVPPRLDRKFRETFRGQIDLDASMDMEDDFANNFDESFEDYEESFQSEDGGLSPPTKSASSPSRGKGRKMSPSASDRGADASVPDDDLKEAGYGSDDFEMMDYEADKPNRKRVRFPRESVVSEVFVTREKYNGAETEELFYTQDEAVRFSLDYSKETMKAEMAGQTWYDWWQQREEEDVIRDEEEEAKNARAYQNSWYDDDDDEGDYDSGNFELEGDDEDGSIVEEIASEEGSNDFDKF